MTGSRRRRRFLAAALAALAALGATAARSDEEAWSEGAEEQEVDQPADAGEEALYEDGRSALEESDYEEALRLFDRVAALEGRRADAALYWKAYALHRMGRRGQSLATIEGLRKAHPRSRWLDDARALELEIRGSSGQPVAPDDVDKEELKLMALNALMNMDPDRAVPMLERFIDSGGAPRLREQALFVLTQTGAPRARQIVTDVARGRAHPELQRKAIEYLGIFGGKENRPILQEIYGASKDGSVRRAVLNAFMISGDTEALLATARDPRDPSLRREAISLLGAQGAEKPLMDLYRAETSAEMREHVLNALGVCGGSEELLEILRTEKQTRLRAAAARSLGITSSARSGAALASLYDAEREVEVRRAVLEALMIQNNAGALVAIARREKDPELKRAAVEMLSVMHSKEATAYMLELLGE